MTGNVNFGYNFDIAFCGKLDYIADFVLSIIAAVFLTVGIKAQSFMRKVSAVAVRADCIQFGEKPGFNSESLILGKMPVEFIELKESHILKHGLDCFNVKEMTAAVEHKSAVIVVGTVLNNERVEYRFAVFLFDCISIVLKVTAP